MTGGASDEVLRDFENIYLSSKRLLERKEEIARRISKRATLDATMQKSIDDADNLKVLEDIKRHNIPQKASSSKELLYTAYLDGFKRLISPPSSAKYMVS